MDFNTVGGVDVLVDEQVVSITFNLWSALKHFRELLCVSDDVEAFPLETKFYLL